MLGEPVELNDENFKSSIAKGVAIVDFYGTYCPPCKLLEPVMDKLSSYYAGRALVARINIDDYSEAAVDNSVEDIPTIIIYKDGAEMERLFGVQMYETLATEVDKLLG